MSNPKPAKAPRPLNLETINTLVEYQLSTWPEAQKRYLDLGRTQRKKLDLGDLPAALQLNPARIVSTGADVSREAIEKRPCFLCCQNRPKEQCSAEWMEGWDLCVNPFPILPIHFTIIARSHRPQQNPPFEMAAMAEAAPDLVFFFNGAKAGASAPDHLHMQAVLKSELPLLGIAEKHHPSSRPGFVSSQDLGLDLPFQFVSAVITPDRQGAAMLVAIRDAFGVDDEGNPDNSLINVFYWMGADRMLRALVIPRRTHRPHHYFLEEPEKVVVAPGAIDMTGLMITPRAVDFEKLDADTVRRIYNEVAFSDALPESVKKHFGL